MPGVPLGVMFKEHRNEGRVLMHYYRKHAAASNISPDDVKETRIRQARLLHVTCITAAVIESCQQATLRAIQIANEPALLVYFDDYQR